MASLAVHAEMKVPVSDLTFANKPEVERFCYVAESSTSKNNAGKFKTVPIDVAKVGIEFGRNTKVLKVFGESVGKTGGKVAVFQQYEALNQKQGRQPGNQRVYKNKNGNGVYDVCREQDKTGDKGIGQLHYLPARMQNWLMKGGKIDAAFIKYIRETECAVLRPKKDDFGQNKAIDEFDKNANWEVFKKEGKVQTIGDLGNISIDIVESKGSYTVQVKLVLRERSIKLAKGDQQDTKYQECTVDLISGEITGEALRQLNTEEGIQNIIELVGKDPASKYNLESNKVWEEAKVNGDHRSKIVPAMGRSWKEAKGEYLDQFKPMGTNLKTYQKVFMAFNRMLPEKLRFDESPNSISFFSSLALVVFTFVLPIISLNFIWRVMPIKLLFAAISYGYLSLLAHRTFSDWNAEPSKTEKFKLFWVGMLRGVGLMILWPLSQFGQIMSKLIGSPIKTREFAIKEGLDTEAGAEKGILKKLSNRYKVGQILGALTVGMTMFFTIGPVILSAFAAMTPVGWVLLGLGALFLLTLIGQAIYGGTVRSSGESPAVGVLTKDGKRVLNKDGKPKMTLDSKNRTIMYLLAKIQDDTSNEGADKDTIFRKFVTNLAHNTSEEVRELYLESVDLQQQLLLELKNGDTTLGVKVFGPDYPINRYFYLAQQAKIIRFFQLCHKLTPQKVLEIENTFYRPDLQGPDLNFNKQLIREMKEIIANSYSSFEEQLLSGKLVAHYPILKKSREIFDPSKKFPEGEHFSSDKEEQKYLDITKKFLQVLEETEKELKDKGTAEDLEILKTTKHKESDDEYTDLLTSLNPGELDVRASFAINRIDTPEIDAEIMQQGFDRARSKMLSLEDLKPRDVEYFNALTQMAKKDNEIAIEQLYMLKADYIKALSEYVKIIEKELKGDYQGMDLRRIEKSSPAFKYFANYLNEEQMKRLYSAVKSHGEICKQFIIAEADELRYKNKAIDLRQKVEVLQKARAGLAEGEPDPELKRLQQEITLADDQLEVVEKENQEGRRQLLEDISWSELMRSEHMKTRSERQVIIEEELVREEKVIPEERLLEENDDNLFN